MSRPRHIATENLCDNKLFEHTYSHKKLSNPNIFIHAEHLSSQVLTLRTTSQAIGLLGPWEEGQSGFTSEKCIFPLFYLGFYGRAGNCVPLWGTQWDEQKCHCIKSLKEKSRPNIIANSQRYLQNEISEVNNFKTV